MIGPERSDAHAELVLHSASLSHTHQIPLPHIIDPHPPIIDPLPPIIDPLPLAVARKEFRKIGFLTSRELSDAIILPLFADNAPYRRHRWNYYTINDTNQEISAVRLPVMFKDRDCMDEVACDEAYSGDHMRVHGYATAFTVYIY